MDIGYTIRLARGTTSTRCPASSAPPASCSPPGVKDDDARQRDAAGRAARRWRWGGCGSRRTRTIARWGSAMASIVDGRAHLTRSTQPDHGRRPGPGAGRARLRVGCRRGTARGHAHHRARYSLERAVLPAARLRHPAAAGVDARPAGHRRARSPRRTGPGRARGDDPRGVSYGHSLPVAIAIVEHVVHDRPLDPLVVRVIDQAQRRAGIIFVDIIIPPWAARRRAGRRLPSRSCARSHPTQGDPSDQHQQ